MRKFGKVGPFCSPLGWRVDINTRNSYDNSRVYDRQIDGLTDRWTSRPSYRYVKMHLDDGPTDGRADPVIEPVGGPILWGSSRS